LYRPAAAVRTPGGRERYSLPTPIRPGETADPPPPADAPSCRPAVDPRRRLGIVGGLDRPGGRHVLDTWELGAEGWRAAISTDLSVGD